MNTRERAFVRAYLGAARGVGRTAAIVAGYSKKTADQAAHRLLRKAKVRAALEQQQNLRDTQAIADAAERDRILSTMARDEHLEARDRIRAIVELNRCSGRHAVALIHKGRSLEQILSESREP